MELIVINYSLAEEVAGREHSRRDAGVCQGTGNPLRQGRHQMPQRGRRASPASGKRKRK